MNLRDNWEEHLRNPPPGSKAYQAKEFGVDMEGADRESEVDARRTDKKTSRPY